MSRRGRTGGAKTGGERGGNVSGYWYPAAPLPRENINTAGLNHCVRDTPMQAAPFTPARSSHNPSAPTSTRKISASFSTDCPLSGHATIAYSSVTASTATNHPGPLSSHPINQSSALPSPRPHHYKINGFNTDRALKTSLTFSNLPMPVAAQCQRPSPKRSMATTGTDKRALYGRNEENIPPSLSTTTLTATEQSTAEYKTPKLDPNPASPKKKAKSRPGIPMSRTFGVFSNLTASLSRTSLGQLTGSDSRQTSASSKSTFRKDKAPDTNPQLVSSASSHAFPSPRAESAQGRQIHTAQSSAYWAGRFMALQDRFRSEMLMPENLAMLVHAHAERSLVPVAQPSLGSSATMSCITPAAKPMHSTTISTSPRKSHQQPPKTKKKSWGDSATPKISGPTTRFVPPRSSCETPTELVDEDARARRIFSYLHTLCATSEARHSLQSWQQAYARRMGKEHLLPEGGTMQERTREMTWISRLLIRSGGGHLKNSKKDALRL